jgi:hypothetical protein
MQSIVGVNSWVAHANKAVWGPDATVFRPERWLVSKEQYNVLDRYFFTVSSNSPAHPLSSGVSPKTVKRLEELTP